MSETLPDRLRDLAPAERRALLNRLMERRNLGGRTAPLSYAQQRLWFLEHLVSGNPNYNETSALRFEFPVDTDALRHSLNDVVRRHEALRTVFERSEGDPRQRVLPSMELKLPIVDFTAIAADSRESEAVRFAQEQGRAHFDLSKGPLLRVSLIRLEAAAYLFVLTMHHIVCDGWSMKIFFDELRACYEARVAGQAAALAPLPIQYADFAVWQRDWLQGGVLDRQLAFWKDQLAGVSALDLITDYPRPAIPTFSGARERIDIPRHVYTALNAWCEQERATTFMALLAAYQVLLHRYTGQDDVAVGVPIANRNRPELEKLIGFFVNTLVMRTDFSGNPSFVEALRRVREVALSAYAHQDVPFERLVEELQPKRDASRNPLFQVTFQMLNAPSTSEEMSGRLRSVAVEMQTAKFDLRCDLWESAGGVEGYIEYSTDLFRAETIAPMARHFETLVESAVNAPNMRIGELAMIATREERRLLVDWNETAVDFPNAGCVHEVFETCAAEHASRVAVNDAQSTMTYAELNREANRLAHYLKGRGIVPGSLVAVLMDRSVEYVLAIVAVLKAGGAYVPLDPAYPPERLAAVVKDAVIQLVLTTARDAEKVPGFVSKLRLDSDRNLWAGQPESNLPRQTVGGSLAYVVFTSGSTGRPKGVEIMHSGLANLVCWHNRQYGITTDDRATLYASPSFDASIWEMWPYLTSGASLWIPSERVHASPEDLATWMAGHRITISFLPTPVAESFIDLDLPSGLCLRALLTGGDKLRGYPRRPLPFRLVNHYGPTENTVVATFTDVTEKQDSAAPPIGKPIANVQAFVLDRHLRPVPVGIKGELYLGGRSLARGYLNDAALTRERFVPNPFDRRPGSRLYRTGDVVRYRPDGNLEFHERVDRQIKMRGFRIEPGDIEAALDQHPLVRKSLVVLRETAAGDFRMAAYVVPARAESSPSAEARPDAQAEHTEQWERMYEDLYRAGQNADAGFNIVGWNSSYSGQPLSEDEMREQVEGTVERIADLRGRRILEIGCGTGLLLLRLAGRCERYLATDFSPSVVASLRRECGRQGLEQVEVLERRADDFSGIEDGSFDVVVLNSVVQYFPGLEYLIRVLKGAVKAVRPGGSVFVGDVRSLPLLRSLHAGIELERAAEETGAVELRQHIERRLLQEQELVIEPGFFAAWSAGEPGIGSVKLEVRRGRHHNELTKFRYDVVLETGSGGRQLEEWEERRWDEFENAAALETYLRNARGGARNVVLREAPSARLSAELRLRDLLEGGDAGMTAKQLRRETAQAAGRGVEPEQLWALEESSGYTIRVAWGESGNGCYDIWCIARQDPGESRWAVSVPERMKAPPKPWSSYANQVLGQAAHQQWAQQLREYLRQRLPEYMVPAQFVAMERLPLTPNGKLNRRALPAPDQEAMSASGSYTAPRGELEERIASIWSEILGVERISADTNFFDLGGHSLLLVKVQSKLKQTVNTSLSIIDLFRYPTIRTLGQAISPGAIEAQASLGRGGDSPYFFSRVQAAGGPA